MSSLRTGVRCRLASGLVIVVVLGASPLAVPSASASTAPVTPVGVTAAAAAASSYRDAVLADGPTSLWRLGEPSGTVAVDSAGSDDLQLGAGVSRGTDGAVGDVDTASSFDGTSAGSGSTAVGIPGPDTFTIEAWVKTTSTAGGKLLGFGNAATGRSNNYDRHLYVGSDGKVRFGVYDAYSYVLASRTAVNDGQWHHVAASLSSAGMVLFVDAKRVATDPTVTRGEPFWGFWRVGGDNLDYWPAQPASGHLAGVLDEVALYPQALTLAQVQAHFVASGRTSPGAPRPADAYGAAVYDSDPDFYWRLGETSGTTAGDASRNGAAGLYSGGVTFGTPGAVSGTTSTAVTLDGLRGAVAAGYSVYNPRVYSQELWFRTTTTRGGKLIGFGRSQTGSSSSYDRHVYMLDDGRLRFGVYPGRKVIIDSVASYNDGGWHHLVAAQGPQGMRLYVDGQLVGSNPNADAESFTGYWRAGGDRTWGGASSDWIAASVDEVAVYSTVLTAADVAAHHQAANSAPTASFTAVSSGLVASFDASGSADGDGTVASYDWTFGDGTSGTGRTTWRIYRVPGSYTVRLTVTDDKGAPATTTRTVLVLAANQTPTASFTSASSGLVASFDASGSADTDGKVASYAWSFGDGTSGTGRTTSRSYPAAGSYTVELTVTDDKGASATTTGTVVVAAATGASMCPWRRPWKRLNRGAVSQPVEGQPAPWFVATSARARLAAGHPCD